METTVREKFTKTLAMFLPGIFLLGFNIGTGSVTAMAKAGATYGMSLLWTIALSCLATFCLIDVYGRYTLVTGETALQAFRKHIHPGLGIFFIVALTAGVSGSVMGVMGIVAAVSQEWSRTVIDGGIPSVYFAAFFSALVYYIFWNGRTQFFERCLAVMVAIMAGCFVLNFFIMMPPPVDIIKGMIPQIPSVAAGSGTSSFLVIASMVGTTVYPGLFIIRTTLVKEAGWNTTNLKQQRTDAMVSVSMMFIISASIMAAAAGTLYKEGRGLTEAAEMITLLEPLVGSFATAIFAIGIIAAGVSSQFPNVLLLPWLLCDYTQSERKMTLTKYRIMVFIISLMGLVVPIFGMRPVLVLIVSQALQSVVLPLTIGCILYLGNRKDLMGEFRNKLPMNIVLGILLILSTFTTYKGVIGVMEQVGQLFAN